MINTAGRLYMGDFARSFWRKSRKIVKACRILLTPVVMSVGVVAAISIKT